MESVVKQRLIGTLVLIALGIVFWPIIFVEPEPVRPIVLEPMPVRPTIDETPLPQPDNLGADTAADLIPPSLDPSVQAEADQATLIPGELGATEAAKAETRNGELSLRVVDDMPTAEALDRPSPRRQAPTAAQNDAAGFAQSWVLQVATVSTHKRAVVLVDRLVDKGYEAFSKEFSADGRTLWRVQIGPKLEREKFTAIKTEIDRVLQVDSKVIRYVQ